MINALRRFYNSFGDRGVMMVIFTVSVIVHSLLIWSFPPLTPTK